MVSCGWCLAWQRGAFRIYHNRVTPLYVDVADYEELEPAIPGGKEAVLTDVHYPELGFRFPLSKLLPPSDCEFEGRSFQCPSDPDYILTQEFGSDWRTPKKDFKPNMVERTPVILKRDERQ